MPFQLRKHFDEDKVKKLAESIQREELLIEPIVVRPKGRRYKVIAGERRVQAVRDYTGIKAIPSQIVKASDLQARRISAAENLQREDLSAIETIGAIVEIVDAELIEDIEYQRAEIGRQRSEVGRQRSEVRSQRSEVRSQKSEVGGRKAEVVMRRWGNRQ